MINNNTDVGDLSNDYLVAQSAEQYRLNTHTYMEIMNVVKKKEEKKMYIYEHSLTTLYRHR